MNEINIYGILKYKPKGANLYSLMSGDVKFGYLSNNEYSEEQLMSWYDDNGDRLLNGTMSPIPKYLAMKYKEAHQKTQFR